jgi:cytidylate kinase
MNATQITSTAPVVTLFESYGSGAEYVGARVAEALGVDFLTQRYSSSRLEEVAALGPQDGDSAFMRFLTLFGHENTDHLDNLLIPSDQAGDNDLVMENNRTLISATAAGGVVLGRNATVVLADNPKALHVKLDGPVEVRIARAAQQAGIDRERASRRQVHEDEVRAAMSQRLYNWDPRENDHYDLVINTGRVDLDTAVEIIVAASQILARRAG